MTIFIQINNKRTVCNHTNIKIIQKMQNRKYFVNSKPNVHQIYGVKPYLVCLAFFTYSQLIHCNFSFLQVSWLSRTLQITFYWIVKESIIIVRSNIKFAPVNIQFEVKNHRFLICFLLSMRCCNHYWNNDHYWNNYFNSGWEWISN